MENVENKGGAFARKTSSGSGFMEGFAKFEFIFGRIILFFYHLRKIAMAAPVVYYALKIAEYNREHLPEVVGLNLQANGEFAIQITRDIAVMGPLALTGGCLLMMFLSRKAMYSWAISIFTLVLPIVILISNIYPV